MLKYCLKILNFKSSANILKKLYTSVGNFEYEQLQHSTYRLIFCCNSNYEKSKINVTTLVSSHLALIPSGSPFPDLSRLKRLDSHLNSIYWRQLWRSGAKQGIRCRYSCQGPSGTTATDSVELGIQTQGFFTIYYSVFAFQNFTFYKKYNLKQFSKQIS